MSSQDRHTYQVTNQDFYHPIASRPTSGMLFADVDNVRATTYSVSAPQPTYIQTRLDVPFVTDVDQPNHDSHQPHSQPVWGASSLLEEIDVGNVSDVSELYPTFLNNSVHAGSPSPAISQHPHLGYPSSSNHLSPTNLLPIHTKNLYTSASGMSDPSTPYYNTPSPTSGYPSSPELARTPITPYNTLRPEVDIYSASSPLAAHIDPRLSWSSPVKIEGRPRALSDSRAKGGPFPNPVGRGPMVPQKRYRPHTTSDRRRYVEEVELEAAIPFKTLRPDIDGFALSDALAGRFAGLAQRDDPMFNERGPSISVRINWPGYNSWSRQIPTRDFRNPPGPITRAKLAKNVAKSVLRFIQEQQGKPMEEDADTAWRVGVNGIQLDHLALVRLDHVSKGSWQAQLCLVNPNMQL